LPSPDLAQRALAHADDARARRERNRRECPELAAFADKWAHMGRPIFVDYPGRTIGERFADRVKRQGGLGVAVQASVSHLKRKGSGDAR
jgi:biotin-(acetyl-CoA carboxylase) ligase